MGSEGGDERRVEVTGQNHGEGGGGGQGRGGGVEEVLGIHLIETTQGQTP